MTGDKVAVGFLHPGEVSTCFTTSLLQLMVCSADRILTHGHGYLAKECASGAIVDGRNTIAKAVVESDADWLLWLDSDMGFAADTLEQLIAAADPVERPVVGALCFAHKTAGKASFDGTLYVAQPTIYNWHEEAEKVGFVPQFDYPADTVLPVAGTGSACILVHRSALEAIRAKYGADDWYSPIVHPTGPTKFSEDLSFCIRLAACGLPLHVATGVKTTHHKGGVYLDEEYYQRQRAAMAAGILTIEIKA